MKGMIDEFVVSTVSSVSLAAVDENTKDLCESGCYKRRNLWREQHVSVSCDLLCERVCQMCLMRPASIGSETVPIQLAQCRYSWHSAGSLGWAGHFQC